MIVAYFGVLTPGNALGVGLATSRTRGRVMAAMGLGTTLLGYGLGPQATGLLSDFLQPRFGVDSLRYAMAMLMLVMLCSVLAFAATGVLARRELRGEKYSL